MLSINKCDRSIVKMNSHVRGIEQVGVYLAREIE